MDLNHLIPNMDTDNPRLVMGNNLVNNLRLVMGNNHRLLMDNNLVNNLRLATGIRSLLNKVTDRLCLIMDSLLLEWATNLLLLQDKCRDSKMFLRYVSPMIVCYISIIYKSDQ